MPGGERVDVPSRTRRRRPLGVLEAATLLSGTGNGVASVALPWLILERTGSPTAAGIVAAATALPLLASSLISGTLVDLVGRRRMAVVSDLLSALAVAAIPVVDATVGISVAGLAALAALGAVFDPAGITARETLLPAAARTAGWGLHRANSVHEAVWGAAFLVGPGVGGVLIAAVGAVGTLWVTAGGFVLSSLLLATVRLPGAGRPERSERPASVLSGTVEGLRYVWRDPLLRTLGVVTMLLIGLYLPVEGVVLPVEFQAQGRPERLGVVVMAMSAGGVAGALGYGAWGARLARRSAFLLALVGTALALLGMAFLPPYGVLVGLALLSGLLYGPVNPLVNVAMQTRTPERLRGRVVGTLTSTAYAAMPLGYLVTGPLVSGVGVRTSFLLLAGGLTVVALGCIALPALRELDAPPRFPPSADVDVPSHEPLPFAEQARPHLPERG